MDGFAALQSNSDEGDEDGCRYSHEGSNLDLALYARLGIIRMEQVAMCRHVLKRTRVADMPGYPTRKLLFGGPETRTKADMFSHGEGSSALAWELGQRRMRDALPSSCTSPRPRCNQGAPVCCAGYS